MKWYEDIREELVIVCVASLCFVAIYTKMGELAGVLAGGLIAYLKREKKNGAGNDATPTPPPPIPSTVPSP